MTEQDDIIESLRQALEVSPTNTILRMQYIKILLSRGRIDEGMEIIKKGIDQSPENPYLKLYLADCYRKLGKPSTTLVIVEELLKQADCPAEAYLLYARVILTRGNLTEASQAYQKAILLNPQLEDKELSEALDISAKTTSQWQDSDDIDSEGRIRHSIETDDAGDELPFSEMEKPDMAFKDVGGMEKVKQQIRMKIIEPLKNPQLFTAYGKKAGGGILLYGPPGCGKTYIARATAGEAHAGFYAIGLHDILDMYIGNSEQKLHMLFEQARERKPCVLFFDEVDALGASRTDMRKSAGRHLINQFLSELDGIQSDNEGVLILAATNAPWHIDPAFRRPGRFDRMIFVPPPDMEARTAILQILLKGKPLGDLNYGDIANKTPDFSGADLKAVVEQAIETKLEQAIKTGIPEPLCTRDLLKTIKNVKPTSKQWFSTAKNYALYSNQSGVYDEIIDFLDLK